MITLKNEEINVNGSVLVVSEATTLMGINRDLAIAKAAEKDYGSEALTAFHVFIYPSLAGCTSGDNVPSAEEVLSMHDYEASKWMKKAQELNPHWFDLDGNLSKEEKQEKKSK